MAFYGVLLGLGGGVGVWVTGVDCRISEYRVAIARASIFCNITCETVAAVLGRGSNWWHDDWLMASC